MNIEDLKQSQNQFFASGATRDAEFRRTQLSTFRRCLQQNEGELSDAIALDLGKSARDSFLTEISVVSHEVDYALENLDRWMRPRRAGTLFFLRPASSRIYPEPRGVVLIIAPWNYPLMLTLSPLVSAIAAGCCAILKPSELVPHTAQALRKFISSAFPSEYIAVVEGGIDESRRLLQQPFGHIFFTGSTRVGRLVYQAAAATLTPVTLELGGKSPAIVAADAQLEATAKRLSWGKLLNAGQTCVAPDYVYAHRSIAPRLLELLKARFKEAETHCQRVLNAAQFDRLVSLMRGAKIYCGGETRREDLFVSPTLLTEVTWNDPIMQEEIFGPLLPVLTFDSIDDVFAEIAKRDQPLSAYLFTQDLQLIQRFTSRLSFGGGCVNDCVLQVGNINLPFGGVGASGIGSYHGERGFLTFSHEKSVMHRNIGLDFTFRYSRDPRLEAFIRRVFGFGARR